MGQKNKKVDGYKVGEVRAIGQRWWPREKWWLIGEVVASRKLVAQGTDGGSGEKWWLRGEVVAQGISGGSGERC